MRILRYNSTLEQAWDAFVGTSRNATFMFRRGYMDYHAHRFVDASLVALDDRDRIVALLPACINGDTVSSHAGLTFGSWLVGPSKPDVATMLDIMNMAIEHYASIGVKKIIYRPIPHIYHKYPAEEDLYALFRVGALIESTLVSSVIDLRDPIPFNKGAKRHVKRGAALGLSVSESLDFAAFWQVLAARLHERYEAAPVHTLDEIQLLHSRFPSQLRLFVVYAPEGELLGGTLLYICGHVVKSQYIAATPRGFEVNAIDYLFDNLLRQFAAEGYLYFDFGPSCEEGGRVLNQGLLSQKVGYGGRAIVYNTFKISI